MPQHNERMVTASNLKKSDQVGEMIHELAKGYKKKKPIFLCNQLTICGSFLCKVICLLMEINC